MRLVQEKKIINFLEPADYQAGVDADSFTMGDAAHATIMLTFGAITGDATLLLYSGVTVAAKTTALPFAHRVATGVFKAANADLYDAEVVDADGSLVLTEATYKNRLFIIEIPAESLPDGHKFITLALSNAADVLLASGVAELSGMRYGTDATQLA